MRTVAGVHCVPRSRQFIAFRLSTAQSNRSRCHLSNRSSFALSVLCATDRSEGNPLAVVEWKLEPNVILLPRLFFSTLSIGRQWKPKTGIASIANTDTHTHGGAGIFLFASETKLHPDFGFFLAVRQVGKQFKLCKRE